MKVSAISTTLIAFLASAVTAVPVASADEVNAIQARAPEDGVEARSTDIGLYFCEAWGWGGECYYGRYQYAVCYNTPGGWNDRISAIGPDAGQGGCSLYPANDCQTVSSPSGSLWVVSPGYGSLSGDVGLWNDVISSWICWP